MAVNYPCRAAGRPKIFYGVYSMKRSRLLSLVFLFASMALLVFGCAQNNVVRLLYNPATPATAPSVTAPRVTVVIFDDQRGRVDIGVRKDGSSFQPGSNVKEWVSYSLADELTRQGAQVSIASNRQQAEAANPEYMIDGVIERVWLTEKNISNYEAAIRLQIHIYNKSKNPVIKNFGAQQSKTGVPGARLAEETLTNTLHDVLAEAVPSILAQLR